MATTHDTRADDDSNELEKAAERLRDWIDDAVFVESYPSTGRVRVSIDLDDVHDASPCFTIGDTDAPVGWRLVDVGIHAGGTDNLVATFEPEDA